MSKIIFIGSGNVATHLSKALHSSGHRVLQVYSKSLANAKKLAKEINADFTNDLGKLRKDADLYFFSVKDNVLPEIVKKINLGNKFTVHTSGSVEMDVLKAVSENYGVFYPMQTFSKSLEIEWYGIPIFIEANKTGNEKKLLQIAYRLAGKENIHRMNSAQRKLVHLAAVFANNFPNHLYVIAEEILKKHKLSFDILRPLILETAKKIQKNSPSKMQTGPAKRGDKKIINEHLKMLNSFPDYKKLYKLLSFGIIKTGEKKQGHDS